MRRIQTLVILFCWFWACALLRAAFRLRLAARKEHLQWIRAPISISGAAYHGTWNCTSHCIRTLFQHSGYVRSIAGTGGFAPSLCVPAAAEPPDFIHSRAAAGMRYPAPCLCGVRPCLCIPRAMIPLRFLHPARTAGVLRPVSVVRRSATERSDESNLRLRMLRHRPFFPAAGGCPAV